MPHITTEKISQIRKQINVDFPGWKFSIRKERHSTVVVSVLEAPYDLMPPHHTRSYAELNHYFLHETYQGQALIDLQHIKQIATTGQDGNVFITLGICTVALKKAGFKDEAKELTNRVFDADSYENALSIMGEYCILK